MFKYNTLLVSCGKIAAMYRKAYRDQAEQYTYNQTWRGQITMSRVALKNSKKRSPLFGRQPSLAHVLAAFEFFLHAVALVGFCPRRCPLFGRQPSHARVLVACEFFLQAAALAAFYPRSCACLVFYPFFLKPTSNRAAAFGGGSLACVGFKKKE